MGRDGLVGELDRIVETLKKDVRVKLVIFFGSTARGEIHSGSDIDLILIK